MGADPSEDLLLDALVLGGGLDHQIGRGQRRVVGRCFDPADHRVHFVLADLALGDLPLQALFHGVQTFVDLFDADVVEQYLVAVQRTHVCDPRTHLPGADHAHDLDVGHTASSSQRRRLCRAARGR